MDNTLVKRVKCGIFIDFKLDKVRPIKGLS